MISALIEEYGEEVVQFYMHAIQDNAERSVRDLLRRVDERFKGQKLVAVDYMDDGSPIHLKIEIDPEKGEATFDFTGTGPQVYGNINAPEAVTYSAVIYVLRCLIEDEIPLNQGCLKPITIKIPKGSFFDTFCGYLGADVMIPDTSKDYNVVIKSPLRNTRVSLDQLNHICLP